MHGAPMTSGGSLMTKRKHIKLTTDVIAPPAPVEPRAPLKGKLGALAALVDRPEGASLAEMMAATGWQAHSVRGAISGALRKASGLEVVSAVQDGERRYRIGGAT